MLVSGFCGIEFAFQQMNLISGKISKVFHVDQNFKDQYPKNLRNIIFLPTFLDI